MDKRQVVILIAVFAIAVLAASTISLIANQEPSRVSYGDDGVSIIAPNEAGPYCPGDEITYPVIVSVHESPVIIHVVEGWCKQGGVCPSGMTTDSYLPVVDSLSVEATARRTIPELSPGVWELRHVAENGEATAYVVRPIEVKACK